MKKIAKSFFYFGCVFILAGWGSTYDHADPAETGNENADRSRQNKDEDIKRTQGDESGRRDIHTQGPLQNDERGTF